jgi:sialidase-1
MLREPVGLQADAPVRIVDEVVIAGRDDRYRYAPSLVQLPDGDLLVAYTEAIGEYPSDNGWVVLRRSSDGGRTWSAPQTVYAEPGWACLGTAGLRLFANGELICFLGRIREIGARAQGRVFHEVRSAISRSADGGRTWSTLEPEIWLFKEINEFFGPGTPIQLADGSELLTICGMNDLADVWLPALVQTRDAGRTFENFRLQIDAPGRNYSDVDMLRLADGRLMAVVREDEAPAYRICQLFSSDDGATWTAPEPTGFTGSSFCLVQLRDSILCIHRDMRPGELGVTIHHTRDLGATWQFSGRLHAAESFRCGSPTVVRLPSGDLFGVYFTAVDHGRSDVVGVWFSEQ